MDSEPSLRGKTLRHIAVVLGSTLAFVGLLCGIMLVVSLATSKKDGTSSSSTTQVEPTAPSSASPDLKAPKAKKPSI